MNKVMFLNELLDVSEDNIRNDFGLKTAGIVKLKNIFSKLEIPYGISKYTKIPDLFTTSDIDSKELKKAYFKLTKNFTAPQIILARSSDRDEKPGVFESHTSLYLPNDLETSFSNWLSAAKKVRDSGARAVIGQAMIGDLDKFEYDRTWDDDAKRVFLEKQSFGGDTTSFFGNSVDFIRGDTPMIVGCYGLASKVARGDNDTSIIEYNSHSGFRVVNLNQRYHSESFEKYTQETIDVVLLDKPDCITTLEYHSDCQSGRGAIYVFDRSSVPFEQEPFWSELANKEGFSEERLYPESLLTIVKEVHYAVGKNIEIEGSVSREGLFLFQLREYDLPKKNFRNLTEVDVSQILLKPESDRNRLSSVGFNQFHGDLYVSDKFIDVPKEDMFLYTGQDIHNNNFDLGQLQKYKKLLFQSYISNGLYAASHSYGQTVQTLFELQRLGISAIALGEDFISQLHTQNIPKNVPEDRFIKTENYTIYKNIMAECVGLEAQIYLAK